MFATVCFAVAVGTFAAVCPLAFACFTIGAVCFGTGYKVASLFIPALRIDE